MSISIGRNAPDFQLLDDQENLVSLKNFAGEKLILYFYPKDDTPGCTKEACNFRDNLKDLDKLSVKVVGISRDSVASHKKFKEKYGLNFPLLADEKEDVCNAYEVLKEKNMYGKKSIGIERSTFLVDENGKISQVWRGVKVDSHIDDIMQVLK